MVSYVLQFRAQPQHMFDVFTNEKMVATYTRSPALIDARVGGKFQLFGGSVLGHFLAVDQNAKIVQAWRFKEWPEDHFSVVTIELEAKSTDVCQVTLRHTNIFGDTGEVRDGWQKFFWDRIPQIMGLAILEENA